MSRDGHASDPFGRPCWCGDVHAWECTCTGVGLRIKLASLTGRTEHDADCPTCQNRTESGAVLTREEGQNHNENVMVLTLGVTESTEVSDPETPAGSAAPLDGERRA